MANCLFIGYAKWMKPMFNKKRYEKYCFALMECGRYEFHLKYGIPNVMLEQAPDMYFDQDGGEL